MEQLPKQVNLAARERTQQRECCRHWRLLRRGGNPEAGRASLLG